MQYTIDFFRTMDAITGVTSDMTVIEQYVFDLHSFIMEIQQVDIMQFIFIFDLNVILYNILYNIFLFFQINIDKENIQRLSISELNNIYPFVSK